MADRERERERERETDGQTARTDRDTACPRARGQAPVARLSRELEVQLYENRGGRPAPGACYDERDSQRESPLWHRA